MSVIQNSHLAGILPLEENEEYAVMRYGFDNSKLFGGCLRLQSLAKRAFYLQELECQHTQGKIDLVGVKDRVWAVLGFIGVLLVPVGIIFGSLMISKGLGWISPPKSPGGGKAYAILLAPIFLGGLGLITAAVIAVWAAFRHLNEVFERPSLYKLQQHLRKIGEEKICPIESSQVERVIGTLRSKMDSLNSSKEEARRRGDEDRASSQARDVQNISSAIDKLTSLTMHFFHRAL
jgi:hypothetical protein